MERFAKILNSSKPSTTFSKPSILDIWQWSEDVSEQYAICSELENKLFLNIDILLSMEQMSARPFFVEFSQIWTILGLFLLINTLVIKKHLQFAKINYLIFRNIRCPGTVRPKYLKKYRWARPGVSLKITLALTETNMCSYFYLPGKWGITKGFPGKEKPKRNHIINEKF